MRKTAAKQMALCGILGALAVVVMLLGGIIPVATFCCPMPAALLMVPVLYECGRRLALTWYGAVSVLCCLLGPDKEAAAIYVFLGWYPVLKGTLDQWKRPARFLVKLILFNGVTAVMYGLLMFVLGMEGLKQEFSSMGAVTLLVLLTLGNITFFLFDALLPRMTLLYSSRFRLRIWKKGR